VAVAGIGVCRITATQRLGATGGGAGTSARLSSPRRWWWAGGGEESILLTRWFDEDGHEGLLESGLL